MRPFPISVQLYSVREAAAKDFPAVLKRIADIGYTGVEFAGFHGHTPKALRQIIDDLGLKVSSNHGEMPTKENVNAIIDTANTLGYTRHVAGFGPDRFTTKAETLKCAEIAQNAAELLKGSGVTFGLHNHWWEFDKRFDGQYPHEILMAAAPDCFAQIDTYWVKVGGADPAAILRQYGARAPLLHIKDGPGVKEQSMTAVGAGIMDWPAILSAAADTTEWLIVELDVCDTDMFEALAESYHYLVHNGFARGRK
ncbi:MAG: sugar phosphate isomerase/epimerase [Anaerolineae bacterium]|nr:sugar phosphate isomerase/epimerase [Thermoflexales bacterium]MDW8406946.1 sugar phosphate isomerase/epimerase [Anaerolineae bacterium]